MSTQAITTKYIGPSNCKGARIKAKCDRGSLVVPYDYVCGSEEQHRGAAVALIDKFRKENSDTTPVDVNTWGMPFVSGQTKDGDWCHVYLDGPARDVIEAARNVVTNWDNKDLAAFVRNLATELQRFDEAVAVPKLVLPVRPTLPAPDGMAFMTLKEAAVLVETDNLLYKTGKGAKSDKRRIKSGKWFIDRSTPVGEDANIYERMPYSGKRLLDRSMIIGVERKVWIDAK